MPFGEADYPPQLEKALTLPSQLSLMIKCAEKLAKDIRFVRVDFYEVNSKVCFGEITFFPAGGIGKFTLSEWDKTLGDMLTLPIVGK